MWEIYALSAIDELKTRSSLKKLTEFELDILYARAKTRLWEKMERLRGVPHLSISDFGTRRRHSFLWQEYVVNAMSDVLGASFTGTSNTYLAYKHDLEAIGTNAHELPMALAALAADDDELRSAQYRILELWQQSYQGELLILLPDTYGTTQFLHHARIGSPTGPASASTAKTPTSPETSTSSGLKLAAAIPGKNASSHPIRSMSNRSSASMPTSAATSSKGSLPPTSSTPAILNTRSSGFPDAASDSVPDGEPF